MLLIFPKFCFLNFRVHIKKQNKKKKSSLFCLQVTTYNVPLESALRFVIFQKPRPARAAFQMGTSPLASANCLGIIRSTPQCWAEFSPANAPVDFDVKSLTESNAKGGIQQIQISCAAVHKMYFTVNLSLLMK